MQKLKRVAAVHDISGFGKCSLTVALPVISACGIEVCPIPTAVLSTNTKFPGFVFADLSEEMRKSIDHWEKIGVFVDAIYSGFLGSAEQIDIISDFAKRFSPRYLIVDPVMGDNGKIYKTYTPEMCDRMRSLVAIADIALPNLTEACILTDTDYGSVDGTSARIEEVARKIAGLGAKNVIITGIEREDKIYNCVLENGEYYEVPCRLLPFRMHGTGDLFASVVTGRLLAGDELYSCVETAAKFVHDAMELSRGIEGADERGVCFEPLVKNLIES